MPPKRADGKGKKPEGGHVRDIMKKSNRKQQVTGKLEGGWNDRVTNAVIPTYKAEEDKHCPKARTRKFNSDSKALAKMNSEKGKGASSWLDKALVSKFEDVPIKLTPSLREKATLNVSSSSHKPSSSAASARSRQGRQDTNMAEVEILQKVIIRENLVGELHKLIVNQNDLGNVLGEVIELVKAVRFQTVDIMEDVEAWQHMQRVPKPFLYRGQNYVVKIFYDMAFLDKYQMVADTFGFQFSNNPMMYNKTDMSGSRVSLADRPFGFNGDDRSDWVGYGAGIKLDAVVDGVEVLRLEHVEKLIMKEFERLEAEKANVVVALPDGNFVDASGVGLDAESTVNAIAAQRVALEASVVSATDGMGRLKVGEQSMDEGSIMLPDSWKTNQSPERMQRKMPDKRGTFGLQQKDATNVVAGMPWKKKFSNAKVKKERVMQLSEEVEQLKAIQAHIEDQISSKVMEYHELSDGIRRLETKRNLALKEARDVGAQHVAIEIAMMTADKQECNQAIKDLQRESYFVNLERKRKRGIVKKLESEVEQFKKQQMIKKKLGQKIQKDGILEALKGLNAMERVVGAQEARKPVAEKDQMIMSEWSASKLLAEETVTDEQREAEDFFPVNAALPQSPGGVAANNFGGGSSASELGEERYEDEEDAYGGYGDEGDDDGDGDGDGDAYNAGVFEDSKGVRGDEDEEGDQTFFGDDEIPVVGSSFQEVQDISDAVGPSFSGDDRVSEPEPGLMSAAAGAGLQGVRALQGI